MVSSAEEIDKALESYRDHALAHLKARRFAEARTEFARAFALVHHAQETMPNFRISLAVVTGLAYPYGALLIRLEDFTAAARYLDEARQCLRYFAARNLLKSRRQIRQYCALTRKGVELESAYLALRQRDYARATAQASQLVTSLAQGGEARAFRRLRAGAHLLLAKAHYEQRHYRTAYTHVTRAVTVNPQHEDAETLRTLIQARLLLAEGEPENALAVAISGCQQALRRLGIDYAHETSASAQAQALLQAVQHAQGDPQIWARVMPDEREEIGEFFVVLGAVLQASAQTDPALQCLLVAGTLLPPADQIDIPEFERLTRLLGEQARHDPLAFGTLGTLLVHPLVLHRWEFLEAVAEALGQLPLYPALACMAALKPILPDNLPRDTYALIDEIHADLEARFGIPGQIAMRLGVRVLSKQSVRFVLRAPIARETAPRFAQLIAATAHHWRLTEVGIADPNPSTPELEALTDLIEEALLQRSLTVEDEQNTRR